MADRDVRLITKRTSVPNKIPTGTTGNELNLIKQGELASNLADRKLYSFDGSNVFEFGSNSFLGLTGGTITGDLNITGGVIAPSLSATTISGGTIYSGTTNLYDIFHQKNGYLLQKAGMVSGSTFAGNPKKATVTFSTNFPNNNYSISVVGMVSRSWSIESKTLSGFTINSNANAAFSSDEVYWQTTENGEGAK